jgi:hypothetical protein
MKKFFTALGVILFILLLSKITIEIKDNYEDKEQDPYILELINELSVIPSVKDIIHRSGLKFFDGRKSYTINKKYIFICIYDKDGKKYPKNQLVLVLLHEIAHAICDEVGHTKKFHQILDDLLEVAHQKKLYDPTITPIIGYCTYNDKK